MDLNGVLKECKQRMDKTVQYLSNELRGIRTGRATSALVEYVKVDYYGSSTDLRDLATISVPEATMIIVKPFDPGSVQNIVKAIEQADLGFNPMVESGAIRLSVPAPSAERRKQLMGQVRKMAEEARVAIRNERRDANKQVDQFVSDKESHFSEDDGKRTKTEIDELTKKHIESLDQMCEKKCTEIEEN